MIVACGNINQPYEVIGVVHAVATRAPKSGGCSGPGGLPVQETYRVATEALTEAARASGGTGLIHVGYDYRLTSQSVGCNNSQAVFEVYAWGTAVRLT